MPHSFVNFLVGEKDWLTERMRALDYRSDPVGVRFGIAYMGGQAILAGEVDTFNLRLELLRYVAVGDLALKIEQANQQIAKLTNEARLDALRQVRAGQTKKGRLKDILNKTQKKQLVNLVREKLKAKVDKLSAEDRGLLDIQPFLDGLELYHQAYIYPHLFAKNINTSEQKIGSFLPLLMAVKSKKQGQIVQVAKFSGIYKSKELNAYFSSLREVLDDFSSPMVFIISGMFLTITISYDARTKEWILINGAELPVQKITSDEKLTEKVRAAFSDCSLMALATEVYVMKDHKKLAQKQLQLWHKTKSWKSLHRVSALIAKESDFSGTSWLCMAARQGQQRIVKALLKAGANPNQARVDEVGPLYMAVKYGHEAVVETLMDSGADPSQVDNMGVSPLLMAGRQRDIEIIRILLGDLNRKKEKKEKKK